MVYVFLAQGFEEIEALCVVDMLRRANIPCEMVAVGEKLVVTGAHNISVVADITEKEIAEEATAVVLPGGMPGTLNLEKSFIVKEQIKQTAQKGGLVAAICAAPSILGHLGLLNNKNATCYDGFEKDLDGAIVTGSATACDGNIITACGPGAAVELGYEIIKYLKGEQTAKEIKKGMKCQ